MVIGNGTVRSAAQSKKDDDAERDEDFCLVQYPDNLNYKDIFYFIFAPTLCYE